MPDLLFWGEAVVGASVCLNQGTGEPLEQLLRGLQIKQLSQLRILLQQPYLWHKVLGFDIHWCQ